MSDRADRRRRSNIRQYSAEDQALNQISKEAETRLQAKRAARAEAREIRLKEIEKQQKEADEKHNRVHELITDHGKSRLSSSRRNSNDSNDSVESNRERDRDIKAELRELEEKYRQAMMTSATLDNEKQTLIYQLELLKDQIEEIEESYVELQREHKDRCRELEMKKRSCTELESEVKVLREHMVLKDKLIEESGFVIMSTESGEYKLEKNTSMSNGPVPTTGSVLLSSESIEILKEAGDGSLGTANQHHLRSSPVHVTKPCSDGQEDSTEPRSPEGQGSDKPLGKDDGIRVGDERELDQQGVSDSVLVPTKGLGNENGSESRPSALGDVTDGSGTDVDGGEGGLVASGPEEQEMKLGGDESHVNDQIEGGTKQNIEDGGEGVGVLRSESHTELDTKPQLSGVESDLKGNEEFIEGSGQNNKERDNAVSVLSSEKSLSETGASVPVLDLELQSLSDTMPRDDSGIFSPDDVVNPHTCFSGQVKIIEPDTDEEGDEFFDAVSTPSPFAVNKDKTNYEYKEGEMNLQPDTRKKTEGNDVSEEAPCDSEAVDHEFEDRVCHSGDELDDKDIGVQDKLEDSVEKVEGDNLRMEKCIDENEKADPKGHQDLEKEEGFVDMEADGGVAKEVDEEFAIKTDLNVKNDDSKEEEGSHCESPDTEEEELEDFSSDEDETSGEVNEAVKKEKCQDVDTEVCPEEQIQGSGQRDKDDDDGNKLQEGLEKENVDMVHPECLEEDSVGESKKDEKEDETKDDELTDVKQLSEGSESFGGDMSNGAGSKETEEDKGEQTKNPVVSDQSGTEHNADKTGDGVTVATEDQRVSVGMEGIEILATQEEDPAASNQSGTEMDAEEGGSDVNVVTEDQTLELEGDVSVSTKQEENQPDKAQDDDGDIKNLQYSDQDDKEVIKDEMSLKPLNDVAKEPSKETVDVNIAVPSVGSEESEETHVTDGKEESISERTLSVDMEKQEIDAGADANVDDDAQVHAIADAIADAQAEAIADAIADAQAEAIADAIADAQAEAIADAIADAQADAIADAIADAQAEAIADAIADAQAHAIANAIADAQADAQAEAIADAIADAQAEAITDAIADAQADAIAAGDAEAIRSKESEISPHKKDVMIERGQPEDGEETKDSQETEPGEAVVPGEKVSSNEAVSETQQTGGSVSDSSQVGRKGSPKRKSTDDTSGDGERETDSNLNKDFAKPDNNIALPAENTEDVKVDGRGHVEEEVKEQAESKQKEPEPEQKDNVLKRSEYSGDSDDEVFIKEESSAKVVEKKDLVSPIPSVSSSEVKSESRMRSDGELSEDDLLNDAYSFDDIDEVLEDPEESTVSGEGNKNEKDTLASESLETEVQIVIDEAENLKEGDQSEGKGETIGMGPSVKVSSSDSVSIGSGDLVVSDDPGSTSSGADGVSVMSAPLSPKEGKKGKKFGKFFKSIFK